MSTQQPPSDNGAPIRHPIAWESPDFYDKAQLDAETRRVFDICHGCRRCFNLCDSFPKLFDRIDDSATGELDSVPSEDFKPVIDACTLCDMCFVNKCPYVPPHSFDLDFPHLILRHRAVEAREKGVGVLQKQMAHMDRNAKLAAPIAPVVNWATDESNTITRTVIEKVTGIDARAYVPKFQKTTFMQDASSSDYLLPQPVITCADQPKVALYATCYGNYHDSDIAKAALNLLHYLGVSVEPVYPGCCGMPMLEQGRLDDVAKGAQNITRVLLPYIEKGYTIVPIVPSCSLMMIQEWPLLLPKDESVQTLARHTHDVMDYLIQHIKKYDISSLWDDVREQQNQGVTLHLACHSRALNKGAKAADLLNLLSKQTVDVIERCSGHGGSWGMMKDHFDTALKVGHLAFKKAHNLDNPYVASECPLAGEHIRQGMERITPDADSRAPEHSHPLILAARFLGLMEQGSALKCDV